MLVNMVTLFNVLLLIAMRRIMFYDEPKVLETTSFLFRDIIVYVVITIVILLFMKIKKKRTIK